VTVAVGEERSGVNLTLQIVQTARVSGALLDPAGQAVTSASVSLYPRRRDQPSAADALVASGALTLPRAVVSASGFSITGVSPGELHDRRAIRTELARCAAAARAGALVDQRLDGR
jgi:hypothetical protein